jgi:hypothetical protein
MQLLIEINLCLYAVQVLQYFKNLKQNSLEVDTALTNKTAQND